MESTGRVSMEKLGNDGRSMGETGSILDRFWIDSVARNNLKKVTLIGETLQTPLTFRRLFWQSVIKSITI
jgi:hypothetical protein